MSQLCFICGCPRSGTTALAKIVNSHPDAAMGIERFRKIAIGANGMEFGPALFERERFIDIRQTDTDLVTTNEAIARKADKRWPMKLIGDKVPRLYARQKFLKDTFPESTLVAIFRDPMAVAMSWQARADNPEDKWPEENGALKALEEWPKSITAIAGAKKTWKDDLIIINYDSFFGYRDLSGLQSSIKMFFERLNLRTDEDICARSANAMYREPSPSKAPAPIPPEYSELIAQARAHLEQADISSHALV